MQRYFGQILQNQVLLAEDDIFHLCKVMRAKVGDRIEVVSSEKVFLCEICIENKKIKDYSKEELDLFLYSPQIRLKNPPSNWPKSAKFEGLYPRMHRSIIQTKEGKRQQKVLDPMLCTTECPECRGTR